MNILLVESSINENVRITQKLRDVFPNEGRVYIYSAFTINNGIKLSKQVKIDIFIVNVNIGNECGIAFCNEIRTSKRYEVAWIVLYSEDYKKLVEALAINFIDYIIKPLTCENLARTLLKIAGYEFTIRKDPALFFKHKGNYYNYEQQDIYYFETYEKSLFIRHASGKTNVGRIAITNIISLISEKNFFRCNRSVIVNVNKIKEIHHNKHGWEVIFYDIEDKFYLSNDQKKMLEGKKAISNTIFKTEKVPFSAKIK